MTTADVPRNERPPFRLADEERDDWESGEDAAIWPPVEFEPDDTRWWKEAASW